MAEAIPNNPVSSAQRHEDEAERALISMLAAAVEARAEIATRDKMMREWQGHGCQEYLVGVSAAMADERIRSAAEALRVLKGPSADWIPKDARKPEGEQK